MAPAPETRPCVTFAPGRNSGVRSNLNFGLAPATIRPAGCLPECREAGASDMSAVGAELWTALERRRPGQKAYETLALEAEVLRGGSHDTT